MNARQRLEDDIAHAVQRAVSDFVASRSAAGSADEAKWLAMRRDDIARSVVRDLLRDFRVIRRAKPWKEGASR